MIDNISNEFPVQLHEDGHFYSNIEDGYDLIMLVPCKPRRMTNQELSYWFRDCPEEHREWKYDCFKTRDLVYSTYEYHQHDANKECPEDILIRRNGGAWEKPLIED